MNYTIFRSIFFVFFFACVAMLIPSACYATTFWADSVNPGTTSFNDANTYELGIQFKSTQSGYITGLRFYKGSSNTGLHYGTLWTSSGTKLADAVYTSETASGWQSVTLDHPVKIIANTTYVATYFTSVGFYAYDNNYFTSGYDSGPLHALSTIEGGNDLYLLNAHKFPTNVSPGAGNYYVDLIFQTSVTPPSLSGSGPLLVITSTDNNFTTYLPEIMRAEGLNEFATIDIANVDASTLNNYDTVVLGEMSLSGAQATMLSNWVTAGGNLIAMRPDTQLASLLGITSASSSLSDAYLLVDTSSTQGKGIVNQTMQYHGTADKYTLNGATALATLYSDAATATTNPAVTIKNVGSNGGQAAAFTYDLAKSVIYTHQGNLAYEGQKRDNNGDSTIRSDDLFYPSYLDLNKVQIPQADEQQRLLANMIITMNLNKKPLPKFWYLPNMDKAAILYAIDDHATSTGTKDAFNTLLANSSAGCSVDDWQCLRGTSWLYTTSGLTNAEAAAFLADGFEFGVHVNASSTCSVCTPSQIDTAFSAQLPAFQAKYTSIPAQTTHRFHTIPWSEWDAMARIERTYSIRFDMNYYYFPPLWTGNNLGFMRGSGFPMKFGAMDGSPIDVYQQTTDYTNDNQLAATQSNLSAMVDRALGSEGYYGIIGTHDDRRDTATLSAILNVVQSKSIPMVSAKQVLTWVDGRNNSTFTNFSWNTNKLTFDITAATGSSNMYALLPNQSSTDTLTSLTRNGTTASYSTGTLKGIAYAYFPATTGTYTAQYGTISSPTSTPAPTTAPSATTSSQNAPSSSSTVDLNAHTFWKYVVNAGPGFIGTPDFINGTGDAQGAKVFIGNTASTIDVFIKIQRIVTDDLITQLTHNPFPWMQGFFTVSDIYRFNVVSAFNGYPVAAFVHPVTIILPYDPDKLKQNGISPNQLQIAWYDLDSRTWRILEKKIVVDTIHHTVATTTTRLTYFAVVYGGKSEIQQSKLAKTIIQSTKLVNKSVIKTQPRNVSHVVSPHRTCIFLVCW